MAHELTALYAKREKSKGFAFLPDDEMQRDFESRFPYTETDDQLQSINEIKEDMERIRPMDRLLCGDVGFGKTGSGFPCRYEMRGKRKAVRNFSAYNRTGNAAFSDRFKTI